LSLARQQARSGNVPAALATWRSMFNGDTPPPSLAPEYYQTMAGDKTLYPQAVSQLKNFVMHNPQDTSARIALGKILTWREETRRDGILLLEPMASGSKEADDGLRQALLWLGAQGGGAMSASTTPGYSGIRRILMSKTITVKMSAARRKARAIPR